VNMADSRARFTEGIEAVIKLWKEQYTTFDGDFWSFHDVTILPRPTQNPHPPTRVVAVGSREIFVWAGAHGHALMVVPYLSDFSHLAAHIDAYRQQYEKSWQKPPPKCHLCSTLHRQIPRTSTPTDAFAHARACRGREGGRRALGTHSGGSIRRLRLGDCPAELHDLRTDGTLEQDSGGHPGGDSRSGDAADKDLRRHPTRPEHQLRRYIRCKRNGQPGVLFESDAPSIESGT
jgi:alkanesulfonate monooxygenase SsuD/methylene tetrahydromethanopterin reductase-like flavin-dependent oxidoreductase (luciferase family)